MRDLTPGYIRAQQRKKLHGVLLPAISAQVVLRPEGARAYRMTEQEWKRAWAKGYDIERAVSAALYRLEVHIAVMAEDASQAVRRGFRAARERLVL